MQRYLEKRSTSTPSAIAADLARHLLTRQHLGKTVIVCDRPIPTMSVVRKYWLRLARQLQKERASTLNAEKILQLTHDITHMQHMLFVARSSMDVPRADVFFITPNQVNDLPAQCYNLYLIEYLAKDQVDHIVRQLPDRSLVINYNKATDVDTPLLTPKRELVELLPQAWQEVKGFFMDAGLDISTDSERQPHYTDALLDTALAHSRKFLRISDDFLELVRLAQPVTSPNSEVKLYDLITTINRRVYALTPGVLSQQFAQSLHEHDEQELHDIATQDWAFALAVG